ncbi:PilC/PilY family type IV pilus protein [Alcanivorax quisquiliarum]|uniref:PilY1 beta-propeller domain-containing protein n=1 Tax=Alcanivorax quisquiliarum TaxID=2933565 RepID=A0ABT0E9I7_9GAMM|nr:PilC/PilY family type IV pilus protein [Alcanivorax quisquiliarum]MCK0538495.1 hypothetical protein [Alcanivorax quisquiliarum]
MRKNFYSRVGSLFLCMMLLPVAGLADDTEIFFSRAKADNEQNEAVANVFIMLDTSGSMRFCANELGGGSGHNATWCSNAENRRINILQNALRDVLENTPDGVRIGLGRFNYRVPDITRSSGGQGQIGGRVLIPVTEVNDATRPAFSREIDRLNDAGEASSGPYAGSQPVGDTPTGRAYAEAARYMMGMSPMYGTSQNGQQNSICVETATREVGCRDVFDGWGEWVPIEGACNLNDPSCKVEYVGDWQPIPGACDTSQETCSVDFGDWVAIEGTCDLSNPETCKREFGAWSNPTTEICDDSLPTCEYIGWTEWRVTREGANNTNCPIINQRHFEQVRREHEECVGGIPFGSRCLFGEWRRTWTCEVREGRFRQRVEQFYVRENAYFVRDEQYYQREAQYREECDLEEYCAKDVPIISDGKYVSPMNMQNQCESNHVILFTDGAPSANDKPGNQGFVNCGNSGSYSCQEQISKYLSKSTNAKGREVKTYNIGLYMGNNESAMRKVSTDGVDGTINADDSEELIRAFANIIDLISENSRTFSSPGVAVNQMNRLEHLDQLYYAVFEPRESSYWEGNMKRYRLVNNAIRDAFNRDAVDPTTAFFKEESRSFWSDEDDGPDVRKGGARAQLEGRRLFYTDASGNMRELDWENDNNPVLYGLSEDANEADLELLKSRLATLWGDPLHSQPVLVNYGNNSENNVVFLSGNDGMLHAIDSRNGEEYFSWMPHVFMSQANRFTINRPGLTDDNIRQIYGLDGSWTSWRRPGARPSSPPAAVYLYGGMRRGGTSYFGLDVTNRNRPKMLWQIDRGQAGFQRLGQTWSQPTLTQVMVDGSPKPVLVFGGGYSPEDHDHRQGDARSNSQDAMGNMVYVVDALTGTLLWSAGSAGTGNKHTTVSDMRWAIPTDISVVDLNFDGVADHLYFGDLGGQLWRVDLNDEDVTDSAVHKIATLSGGASDANRRFFYPPAVAYVQDEQGKAHLYITIGSGYRAHPLDESVDDYFFVLRDSTAPLGEAPATLSFTDLITVPGNTTPTTASTGWKIALPDAGEKVTAASTVFSNHVFFTTYQPGGDQLEENPCAVRMGTTYLYIMDLVTGSAGAFPGVDIDSSTRRVKLEQDTLAPTPTWLSGGEDMALIVGTEVVGGDSIGATGMRRGSWYALKPQEADLIPLAPE